jgi:hypothetical protein
MPSGSTLVVNVLSTWGDPHYLGATGIELFDARGDAVVVRDPAHAVWADPADINVLPEYKDDPRGVKNLFDGVNDTNDDLHTWLAPFTRGENHFIGVKMPPNTFSAIRIYNYNKSRIHSHRGHCSPATQSPSLLLLLLLLLLRLSS